MTDQAKQDRDEREVRLEKARKELLATVETLRGEMLTKTHLAFVSVLLGLIGHRPATFLTAREEAQLGR